MKLNLRSVITVFLIVFWPAVLWLMALGVIKVAGLWGCQIWAQGPEQCLVLGTDIGPILYPLWAMGYYLALVVGWIPIGLLILVLWGVAVYLRK